MSDFDPDESFPGYNFSDFTEEDFAKIDAAVASAKRAEDSSEGFHNAVHAGEESTESQTTVLDEANTYAEVSFQSDVFDLNLRTLTAENFERLENTVSGNIKVANGGPTVQIQIEDTNNQPTEAENILHDESFVGTYGYKDSPLAQFRAWTSLSVTDLVSPAW